MRETHRRRPRPRLARTRGCQHRHCKDCAWLRSHLTRTRGRSCKGRRAGRLAEAVPVLQQQQRYRQLNLRHRFPTFRNEAAVKLLRPYTSGRQWPGWLGAITPSADRAELEAEGSHLARPCRHKIHRPHSVLLEDGHHSEVHTAGEREGWPHQCTAVRVWKLTSSHKGS